MVEANLSAARVRVWCWAALAALRRHRELIDRLNVYPVPDADTGTNLAQTWAAAADQLIDINGTTARDQSRLDKSVVGWSPAEALESMARGALYGAHGNSGAMLAELLRAFAASAREVQITSEEPSYVDGSYVDGKGFAAALTAAARGCERAVAEPIEGTLLSVLRAAASGANAVVAAVPAGYQPTAFDCCEAAVRAAREAVARTPEQLDVLGAAGVVDAGGCGLFVVLDALCGVLDESWRSDVPAALADWTPAHDATDAGGCGEIHGVGWHGVDEYEIQCLLAAPDQLESLRRKLAELGGSLVITGGATELAEAELAEAESTGELALWNVHVHVAPARVGEALDACVAAGTVRRADVTWLGGDPTERRQRRPTARTDTSDASDASGGSAAGGESTAGRVAVVPVAGDGLRRLVVDSGAVAPPLVTGRGALAALSAVIEEYPGAEVIVVSTDAVSAKAAAEAMDGIVATGRRAAVVPAESPVQALAALALYDGTAEFDDILTGMTEAADATRWVHLTETTAKATTEALDRMLSSGGELVTVVLGADVPDGVATAIEEHVKATWPDVQLLELIDGGQQDPPIIVGVE